MKHSKQSVLAALLLTLLPAFAWAETQADAIKPVQLLKLEPQNQIVSRQFYGRITARSTLDLAFQTSGQIEQLPVIEGQSVAQGSLLSQLDLAPFERSVAQARAEMNKAKADLARFETLGRDVVAENQIDSARTAAELAEIAYQDAQDRLDKATLTAPFDGLIARRYVERYSNVSAGVQIVRLHDMSEMRVEIAVPEVLFRQVGPEPELIATASRLGTDEQMPLEFREITAETSSVGQTYTISFAVVDEVPSNLLPGASVTVTLSLVIPQSYLGFTVPVTALNYAADGSARVLVFTPGADGQSGSVQTHPVTIEAAANGSMRIVDGIEAGTEIVAAGAAVLQGGEQVRRYTGHGSTEAPQ
ncbi:efflux RND transporter periplasmic adaptor subunit [Saccharospirillum mangrovi]|uniref:efflux RND transporter periplasmic adaptor subunit n=1 Tax=Saccharospirillum mangrovi TaxID=2161747 RepID=UPI000D34692C|nr:efflux RND transporter periplasmic adaptor subunit [Saccharospirillum mangrovi]